MTQPQWARDQWSMDERTIICAKLAGNGEWYRRSDGYELERFERNGEMEAIPYLRATVNGVTVEAPLTHWEFVEFAEAQPE